MGCYPELVMRFVSTRPGNRVRDIAPMRMRIILGSALVLLMLVVGAWSVLHTESGSRIASASNTPVAILQVDAAANGDEDTVPAMAVGAGTLTADGTVLGIAGCALGALCGLLIIAVSRRLLRGVTGTVIRAGRVRVPRLPSARSDAPSPSIVELSVLRI